MKFTKSAIVLIIVLTPIALVGGAYLGSQMPIVALAGLVAIIGLLVWILASNKQGARLAGPALDAARELRAPEGLARVFVARRGFMGSQQGMNIALGDEHEGQMRAGFLLVADVAPGVVTLSARMNKQSDKTRATHELNLTAGAVVLVEIGLISGMVRMSPTFDEVADRDAIRRAVANAKPIAWLREPGTITR